MIDPKDLGGGTRPDLGDKILITPNDGFEGYAIQDHKGIVWGVSMRSKDVAQDCTMSCKQLTGGELTSFTELEDESRQKAIERMMKMTRRIKGNAITNFHFETQGGSGMGVIIVQGTAVVIEPIKDYVPREAWPNLMLSAVNVQLAGQQEKGNPQPEPGPDSVKGTGQTPEKVFTLAKVKVVDQNLFAFCPSCHTRYEVSKIIGDARFDAHPDVPGQQVRCKKCETEFTLPELDDS